MVATIATFNPYSTTNGLGSFNIASAGLVQGQAQDDPSTRFRLRGGILSVNETLPMWGGIGVYEDIPGATGAPGNVLGPVVGRATTLTITSAGGLAGFSVFDADNAMVITPSSPVPTIGSYGRVHYYPLGSLARIAVACDPNLAEILGDPTSQQVSWDLTNQMLIPYASTTISSSTVYQGGALTGTGTYNNTTGAVSVTTTNAHGLVPGDTFTMTATAGTGAFAQLAGTWVAGTGTTGSTLDFLAPAGLGATTITAGSLTTNAVSMVTAAGSGLLPGDTFVIDTATGANSFAKFNGSQTAALNSTGTTLRFLTNAVLTASTTLTGGNVTTSGVLACKVLLIEQGNSMIVSYNAVANTAVWNRTGTAAIIQI